MPRAAAPPRSAKAGARKGAGAGPLAVYREKRDFARTAEPAEGGAEGRGLFVVQHHWARREHYDFRLELDGVLVSFAVTKGPSLDPSDRRLAVRTEDHPIAYAEFEGTIPKGEYGGGTVMVWDRGVWAPMNGDPKAALAKGELKVALLGERMQGGWVLVRMNVEKGRENWLLIKEKDPYAVRGGTPLTERHPTSVASGRDRAAIEAEETPHSFEADRAAETAADAPDADAAPDEDAPSPPADLVFVPPALCAVRPAAPEGDGWVHEIKYDGYRIQAAAAGGDVRLFSREGLDWTHRLPEVAAALKALDLDRVSLDGEAVVFDRAGLTDFPALVAALGGKGSGIAYVAFDLLAEKGRPLLDRPLLSRKARLAAVLAKADGRTVRVAPFVTGGGPEVFKAAVEGGAEGIVSKRADAPYRSGRGSAFVKVKGEAREDVVVVGWLPSDKRAFRALHCAVEDGPHLRYVGGVGTGFSADDLSSLEARLAPDRRDSPPPDLVDAEAAPKGLVWVEPRHRIEVKLAGWTGDGRLRHARFLGLREDRAPRPSAGRPPKAAVAPERPEKPAPAKRKSPAAGKPTAKPKTAPAAPAGRPSLLERVTHPERIVFPEAGVTKGDVAAYYVAVADRILKHLKDRPVSFVRAPEGLAGETFFQRHPLPGMKRGVDRIPDPRKRHGDYLVVESAEGLVTAAQFGVIEFHGWNALRADLDAPDRMVFDFDPDEGLGFDAVKEAAFALREILTTVGLKSYPLASGGKGLHVVVPLDRSQTMDDIGAFSGGVARGLAKAEPKRYVAVASKARRRGRIFVDWLRNRPTSTAIVPWSVRARPGASVAVPLAWEEVEALPAADAFDVRTAVARDDPWRDFFRVRQRIEPEALRFLKGAYKR